ncbi:TPA: transcriptional regulator [Candidatus Delongbacteria bacterium]|nr:transcriptional regulator [Candidatus Delongbacteria bacterium]
MKPTASELDILQILWQNGNMTVKDINEEINKVKETGYTTTLKLMQIMHEKGLLSREQNGRSHVYKASIKEDDTKSSLLKYFIQSTFNGSTASLVMQALGDHKTTREELEMIRELLNDIEKGKK